jgi:hypothetical protein
MKRPVRYDRRERERRLTPCRRLAAAGGAALLLLDGHDRWLEGELAALTPPWDDLAGVRRHVAGVLARALQRAAPAAAPAAPPDPR